MVKTPDGISVDKENDPGGRNVEEDPSEDFVMKLVFSIFGGEAVGWECAICGVGC